MADRARIIELNDQLRTTFKGGRVRVIPTGYELDARLCGRALCVMSRYARFDPSSDHDWGRFVFAGYIFEWILEDRDGSNTGNPLDPSDLSQTFRVLTLRPIRDLLVPWNGSGEHPQFPSSSPQGRSASIQNTPAPVALRVCPSARDS